MRIWIAGICLVAFTQITLAQADAVKPPRPPEPEPEIATALPRPPNADARLEKLREEYETDTAKTANVKINYALKAKEGDLNRLRLRLKNAQKKLDGYQKRYDEKSADPEWFNSKEGADVVQNLNKASEDVNALQWQTWDLDDVIQEEKGQPLHGRMLLIQSGKHSQTLPTIVVGSYPVTVTWSTGADAPHRFRVMNAAGETLFRSTANRGEQKLKAAGTYNVEIASEAHWFVTVWRGEME